MTELRPSIANRVAAAVVRLPRRSGQGVLVPGGLVVTAAHCIVEGDGWADYLPPATGASPVERVIAEDGRELKMIPVAIDPISDLAVLGGVDGQIFPTDAEAFEEFCR
jgi:hypothetical protein